MNRKITVWITILVIGIVSSIVVSGIVADQSRYSTDPYNRTDPYLATEQLNLEITGFTASQITVEVNNTVYSSIRVSSVKINSLPVAIEPFIAPSDIGIVITLPGTFVNGTNYTVTFLTSKGYTFETSATANFS